MLGSQFNDTLLRMSNEVYTLNRKDGDLLDFNFIRDRLSLINPDLIIHCIADTNLIRCEKQQKQTLLLHCGLTHCLSNTAAKVVYISTASVMDPCNFYDKTKLLGEQICLLNNKKNLIIRTNIYGTKSSSGNSLFEWAHRNLRSKKKIPGFSDVYFNAVYSKQLVRAVLLLIRNNCEGIINVAGNYQISKYQFLQKVCDVFQFNKDLIFAQEMPSSKLVNRSKNTVLDVKELQQKYDISLDLLEGLLELKKDLE